MSETRTIDLGLAGQVALVTGAGSQPGPIGNGAATAITLARAGAAVGVLDVDAERAAATAERIASEGGSAIALTADVSSEPECRAAIADVAATFGPPRILVNNVGQAGPPGTALDVDLERWEEAMRVNVRSMVVTARLTVPAMAVAGGGAIVNVASVAGIMGGHPALLYATSKGAVVQLTRTMAAQHGGQGIRVNCLAPGMLYTSMVSARGITEEMREMRRRSSLLGTEGTGWDLAAAALFLASDLARWITGVVLPVDAGYSAARELPTPPRA